MKPDELYLEKLKLAKLYGQKQAEARNNFNEGLYSKLYDAAIAVAKLLEQESMQTNEWFDYDHFLDRMHDGYMSVIRRAM